MKTETSPYRTFVLIMLLLVSSSTIIGAQYRGDLPRSPFSRFLYNLHKKQPAGSSFNRSRGTEYNFTYLKQGHVRTSTGKSGDNPVTQADIWSTKTDFKHSYSVSSKSYDSGRSKRSSVSYAVVSEVAVEAQSMASFAPVIAIATSRGTSQGEPSSIGSSGFSTFGFGKANIVTYVNDDGGGTDPGGDPPGDPLSVGDGFLVLLVFVLIYTFIRRKLLFGEIMKSKKRGKVGPKTISVVSLAQPKAPDRTTKKAPGFLKHAKSDPCKKSNLPLASGVAC